MRHGKLYTDGGARGNPGPAGAGFVLGDNDGLPVAAAGRYLGEATNNVAEYEALIWGLENARAAGFQSLEVLCDSELVVRQLNGQYKVKNQGLKPLFIRALELIRNFEDVTIVHIDRAENCDADAQANAAMDAKATVGEPLVEAGEVTEQTRLFDQSASVETPPCEKGTAVYELTVKDHFDAAHTLVGYPGECSALHGHTWDVEVTVAGSSLDDIGIVYDFKDLKSDLSSVLEAFDHGCLNDVEPFDSINPTAENLARVICERLTERIGSRVTVTEVAVWESPIARLVYRPE